jgi:hypothetical protein
MDNSWADYAKNVLARLKEAGPTKPRYSAKKADGGAAGDLSFWNQLAQTMYDHHRSGMAKGGSADGDDGEDHPAWIPQRIITSKKAKKAGPNDRHVVDLDIAKQTRPLFERNVNLLRSYPNIPAKIANKASHDKLSEYFINHVKDNLLALHDDVPEEIRNRSKLWYDGARKIVDRWKEKYNLPDHSIAGALAALSPQKDWFQNVSLAERVLDAMKGGGGNFYNGYTLDGDMEKKFRSIKSLNKPEYHKLFDMINGKSLGDIDKMPLEEDEKASLQAMWLRLHDETYAGRGHRLVTPEGDLGDYVTTQKGAQAGTGWGSLTEIGKAIRAIKAADSPEALSQLMGKRHKVRNFYNNILSPNSMHGDVTIDTHAVAAGLWRPLAGNDMEVAHNFGTYAGKGNPNAGGSALTGVQGLYPLYAEAYRRAAKERGILPREMQSITWEAIRGMFPDTYKTAKNKAAVNQIWDEHRRGRITADEARAQIKAHAGGIRAPAWVERPPQVDETSGYTGDAGELSEPPTYGEAAEGAVGGAGGRYPTSFAPSGVRRRAPGTYADGGTIKQTEGENYGTEKLDPGAYGAPRPEAGEIPDARGIRGGEGLLSAPDQGRGETPLIGLPTKVKIPATGETIEAGPDPRIRAVARQYMEQAGLPYHPPQHYKKVKPEEAAKIARAYEELQHDPDHPLVQASYAQMIKEVSAQYEAAKAAGAKFEFWDPEKQADPYEASPRLATEDLRKNHHMYVFPTHFGYGNEPITERDIKENPLLADSGERWNGYPVTYNDIFRAIHDYYGHAKEGVGFRGDGEENAWRAHASMFSPLARLAMTTETRGQNSWLNYGPHGEANRKARTEDTVFAPQKIGVPPMWVLTHEAEDFVHPRDIDAMKKIYREHGMDEEHRSPKARGGKAFGLHPVHKIPGIHIVTADAGEPVFTGEK